MVEAIAFVFSGDEAYADVVDIFKEIVEVKRCFNGSTEVLDELEMELDSRSVFIAAGTVSSRRDETFSLIISFCMG